MTHENTFALFGHIAFTPSPSDFVIHENSFLVCENGKAAGIFPKLPEKYGNIRVYDYKDKIIIPGLCDTHVHAPQFAFRGLGMDMELIDWLNAQAFPEEERYADLDYAEKAYSQFVDELKNGATTRACIFATVHIPATLLLERLLEASGLRCLVGKVNMNRYSPKELCEEDEQEALRDTEEWINTSLNQFERTRPIITPRFVISCTEKLMVGLGKLARKYNLSVQSHLSESMGEMQWVKELCPWADSYADVYEIFDLLGGGTPTVMAHCVHSGEYEREWLKKRGVLISHCPSSNTNLSSGIAPVRRYLDEGQSVSLGSDVAGGFELSIFRAMTDAVQSSKLQALYDSADKPITISEAFYMGTKGAAPLFGNVGSFENGCELDAVALDDSAIANAREFTVRERLERGIYLEKQLRVAAKFVAGEKVL